MAKFEERFGLQVQIGEARKRFVHRAHYLIFSKYVRESAQEFDYIEAILVSLGRPEEFLQLELPRIVGPDFYDNLKAIECVRQMAHDPSVLDAIVSFVLNESEIDLGVRWENGVFVKAGAPLLDDKLVRDVLGWARDKTHETVLAPFEKGLRHFL